jgi:hypothetical protein
MNPRGIVLGAIRKNLPQPAVPLPEVQSFAHPGEPLLQAREAFYRLVFRPFANGNVTRIPHRFCGHRWPRSPGNLVQIDPYLPELYRLDPFPRPGSCRLVPRCFPRPK